MQTLMPILIDASLKGLAILLLAVIATAAMRRSSAAARHLVWSGAVVAVLAMPLLSALLPGLSVLPGVSLDVGAGEWASLAAAPAQIEGPAQAADEAALQPVASSTPLEPVGDNRPAVAADNLETAVPRGPGDPMTAVEQPGRSFEQSPSHKAAATPASAPPDEWSWQAWLNWLPWIWLGGAGFALIPLALGWLSLWHLRRTSEPVTASGGGSWRTLMHQLQDQIGLRRPVVLLKSPCRTMPMTWGGGLAGWLPGAWGKAKVLIPEDASEWSPERRRAVLLHELAHVQRRDGLTQLLTQLACALYWFNPLMWYAAHRMLIERERACDDLVLTHKTKASDYAQHLLDIATGPQAGLFAAHAGIAMARRSKLDGRLVAILDQHRNRRAMSRLGMALTITLIGAVAVPVACVRMAEQAKREQVEVNGEPDEADAALASEAAAQPQSAMSFDDLPPAMIGETVRVYTNIAVHTGTWVEGFISEDDRGTFYQGTLAELDEDHLLIRSIPPIKRVKVEREYVRMVELIVEQDAAAEEVQNTARQRPITVTLQNEVAVNLVAVAERHRDLQRDPAQWWTAAGEPITPDLVNHTFGRVSAVAENHVVRTVVIRLTDFGGEAPGFAIEVDGAEQHDVLDYRRQGMVEIAYIASFPRDQSATDLRLGIATGPWQTIIENVPAREGGSGTAHGHTVKIDSVSMGESAFAGITYDWPPKSKQIQVISSGTGGLGAAAKVVMTDPNTPHRVAAFWPPPRDLQGMQDPFDSRLSLRTRDYHWVEFRNVSLQPGHETEVEVVINPADAAPDEQAADVPGPAVGDVDLDERAPASRAAAERFLDALRERDVDYVVEHFQPLTPGDAEVWRERAGEFVEGLHQETDPSQWRIGRHLERDGLAIVEMLLEPEGPADDMFLILQRQADGRWVVRAFDDGPQLERELELFREQVEERQGQALRGEVRLRRGVVPREPLVLRLNQAGQALGPRMQAGAGA